MRRGGIIHPELARVLAGLGHRDVLVIADAGLPVPPGVARIDLAYRLGAPRFADVVQTVADELVVEQVVVAVEAEDATPETVAAVRAAFPDCDLEQMSHQELKRQSAQASAVVRTGEATPYANVLIRCGVPFG
ncbi:D-ribose pyranase [Pseudonocardia nantongensis]|uniref:D-ribose pyranase n=1 Tax=Pseudonocardia nantongensis TaxID=1181885 RepID=UPI00397D7590